MQNTKISKIEKESIIKCKKLVEKINKHKELAKQYSSILIINSISQYINILLKNIETVYNLNNLIPCSSKCNKKAIFSAIENYSKENYNKDPMQNIEYERVESAKTKVKKLQQRNKLFKELTEELYKKSQHKKKIGNQYNIEDIKYIECAEHLQAFMNINPDNIFPPNDPNNQYQIKKQINPRKIKNLQKSIEKMNRKINIQSLEEDIDILEKEIKFLLEGFFDKKITVTLVGKELRYIGIEQGKHTFSEKNTEQIRVTYMHKNSQNRKPSFHTQDGNGIEGYFLIENAYNDSYDPEKIAIFSMGISQNPSLCKIINETEEKIITENDVIPSAMIHINNQMIKFSPRDDYFNPDYYSIC